MIGRIARHRIYHTSRKTTGNLLRPHTFEPTPRMVARALSSGLERLRNVGVVAHIDAGKTTTTEGMLYCSGHTQAVGRVDTGDTVMDFLPQERERGITISSAAISFQWKGYDINLIDTPGHVDFTIEVERSTRVLDGAIVIIDAVSGVQSQTRTVWKQTQRQKIPAIAFINKMDRVGANFRRAVDSLKKILGANSVPMQMPILVGDDAFAGVVDLLSLNKIVWSLDSPSSQSNSPPSSSSSRAPPPPVVTPLAADDPMYADVIAARKEMIEAVAEVDDELMQVYLDDKIDTLSMNDLLAAIRRGTLTGALVPTLCGASLRGKGVEPLLDSLLAFLPSPLDRPPAMAVKKLKAGTDDKGSSSSSSKNNKSCGTADVKALEPRSDENLCAFVFKVVHDPARGPLTFIRVYSGTLQAKQVLYNSTVGARERVNQLLHVSADDLSAIESLPAGNVGCLVGMKNTRTGDTLVIEKGPLHSYVLDGLVIPPPVFSLAIEPEKSSQQTELEQALAILQLEDPSLCVEMDKESGQTMLKGIGELHLEIVCDKLKRQFNIEVMTGRAYVAYRETILLEEGEVIEHQQVYDRTLGTKRLFAGLSVQVRALTSEDMSSSLQDKSTSTEVTNASFSKSPEVRISDTAKQSLSAEEVIALTEGFQSALQKGPKGFPVVGLRVDVTAVQRDPDTTSGSLRACASVLCNSLLQHSSHSLLEPIMALEVEAPRDFIGTVLSDLTQRRAQVKNVGGVDEDDQGNAGGGNRNVKGGNEGMQTILAHVPLATMLGYSTAIRSMTQGQAGFSLEYVKHLPVGYL